MVENDFSPGFGLFKQNDQKEKRIENSILDSSSRLTKKYMQKVEFGVQNLYLYTK